MLLFIFTLQCDSKTKPRYYTQLDKSNPVWIPPPINLLVQRSFIVSEVFSLLQVQKTYKKVQQEREVSGKKCWHVGRSLEKKEQAALKRK